LVAQVPLAGDHFRALVLVEVGQQQRVELAELSVDRVLPPLAAVLLQPVQPRLVSTAPDQVGIAVTVGIVCEDRDARIAVQSEVVVPDPAASSSILGALGPSA